MAATEPLAPPLDEQQFEIPPKEEVGEEEEDDDDDTWSSDSEIGEALDYLDSKEDTEHVDGGFTLNSRRPNAHGGLHSRPNSSALQPLSNRQQKFSNRIRASPLEVGSLVV